MTRICRTHDSQLHLGCVSRSLPEGFDIKNPVGTNLAYYLDPDTTGTFVRSMASALDVLTIWSIVLVGIGFSCTSKVKRSTAIIVVAAWYVLYKIVFSAIGA